MGDLKGIDVSDVLGAGKAVAKLCDCASSVLGKLYEPCHIKRIAHAKAEEIQIISDAINNNMNLPSEYSKGEITIDSRDFNELAKRTNKRLLFQEMTKQQNMEAVISQAALELKDEKEVSKEPVDNNWLLRFFDAAGEVSDEDLQKLWAKILAGEVKNPNTYSLRTLSILKNMNKKDAETFQKIAQFVLRSGNDYFIPNERKLFDKYDISYNYMILLEEAGLVTTSPFLQLKMYIDNLSPRLIFNKKVLTTILSNKTDRKEISLGIYLLTECGKQLYRTIDINPNAEYFIEYSKKLKDSYKELEIKTHKIKSFPVINGKETINFEDEDLVK